MMTTPIEIALEAKAASEQETEREEMLEIADRLANAGAFSNRQIASLTGLPRHVIDAEFPNPGSSEGGLLALDTLELIFDLLQAQKDGGDEHFTRQRLAISIMSAGTSTTMIERLTGIGTRTLQRWRARGIEHYQLRASGDLFTEKEIEALRRNEGIAAAYARGLSDVAIADEVGCSRNTVIRWREHPSRALPSNNAYTPEDLQKKKEEKFDVSKLFETN